MVDTRYDEVDERGGRNPWLVLLWVVAGVLLGAGAALISQSGPAAGTGDSVVPVFVLPAVVLALAPWLVGTGLAAVVGAVLVHALRWRG